MPLLIEIIYSNPSRNTDAVKPLDAVKEELNNRTYNLNQFVTHDNLSAPYFIHCVKSGNVDLVRYFLEKLKAQELTFNKEIVLRHKDLDDTIQYWSALDFAKEANNQPLETLLLQYNVRSGGNIIQDTHDPITTLCVQRSISKLNVLYPEYINNSQVLFGNFKLWVKDYAPDIADMVEAYSDPEHLNQEFLVHYQMKLHEGLALILSLVYDPMYRSACDIELINALENAEQPAETYRHQIIHSRLELLAAGIREKRGYCASGQFNNFFASLNIKCSPLIFIASSKDQLEEPLREGVKRALINQFWLCSYEQQLQILDYVYKSIEGEQSEVGAQNLYETMTTKAIASFSREMETYCTPDMQAYLVLGKDNIAPEDNVKQRWQEYCCKLADPRHSKTPFMPLSDILDNFIGRLTPLMDLHQVLYTSLEGVTDINTHFERLCNEAILRIQEGISKGMFLQSKEAAILIEFFNKLNESDRHSILKNVILNSQKHATIGYDPKTGTSWIKTQPLMLALHLHCLEKPESALLQTLSDSSPEYWHMAADAMALEISKYHSFKTLEQLAGDSQNAFIVALLSDNQFTLQEPLIKLLIKYLIDKNQCVLLSNTIQSIKNANNEKTSHIIDFIVHQGLTLTIQQNKIDIMDVLITHDIPLDVPSNLSNSTPLIAAIQSKNIGMIRCLVNSKKEIGVNALIGGFTPIFFAVSTDNRDVVNLVIQANADVNYQLSEDGYSPLIVACINSCFNAVEILLEHRDLAVNAKAKLGYTALHYAAFFNRCNIIDMLVAAGADAQIQNVAGKTPLCLAQMRGHYEAAVYLAVVAEDIKAINLCRNRPINFNINRRLEGCGMTPLIVACKYNRNKIARKLIKLGCDLDEKDSWGNTAVHYAAMNNRNSVLQRLANAGANMATKNGQDTTPSGLALSYGHYEAAAYLAVFENNAHLIKEYNILKETGLLDINLNKILESYGMTPLMVACMHSCDNAAQTLIELGYDLEERDSVGDRAVHYAARYSKNPAIMGSLIYKGAQLADIDSEGFTPLMRAVIAQHAGVVNCLINAKNLNKDIGLDLRDFEGNTAVNWAVLQNNYDIINSLVNAGANLSIINGSRESPLMRAIKYGRPKVAMLILGQKGDIGINLQDSGGYTAMDYAIKIEDFDLCEQLLAKGARLNTCTSIGNKTPLIRALKKGNDRIAQLLLESKNDDLAIGQYDVRGNRAIDYVKPGSYLEQLLLSKSNVADRGRGG
ncbi:MAG: ankyrin repeat domain-containing protein [Alphaproteobacteria bacterium]|nr:ankyrin repeat domain-containing protein [Alphaproteobacteria bacterium]